MFATLSIVLGACTPTLPSSPPGTPAPSASPVAVATTSPTPIPTLRPAAKAGCPNPASLVAGGPLGVDVAPDPSRAFIELQVTAVEPVWDPASRFVASRRDIRPDDTGVLAGGHEFTIWPQAVPSYLANPLSMVAATATLTPDGQPARELGVRIVPGNKNFDQFAITVPDLEGRALLDLEIRWQDQCFIFTAEASQEITVVPLALTKACHLDQDHWFDDLAGVFDRRIKVNSTTQKIFPVELASRFASQETGGDPPSWAYFWKEDPRGITAVSGSWLEVSDPDGRRHTAVTDVELFRRADALRAADDYYASIETLWNHHPTPRADGSFRIPVAADPGRYVLVIRFTFESACLTGSATSAFSLDVN